MKDEAGYAFTFALVVFKTDLHRSEACASKVQSPDIAVKNIFQRSLDTRQKIMPTKVLGECSRRVPCIFYTIFPSFLGNWFGIFKRDKNSRLLVETLKRKVLLFSYICSIKKSKQHGGFIYVTRYRSFFITFVLSRRYPLPSRFPARRFPISKIRFFLSNFPASFPVHRIDAQSRCLFAFIALNIFA